MSTLVVTGGSRGIGAAICARALDDGYEVIALDRDAPADGRVAFHPIDLTDRDALARLAAELAGRHTVTHLVHNAGVIRPALLPDVELADLDYLTELHLGAAITLAKAFLPAMKAAGHGRIVNVSSRAALGLETRTNYSATKAALIGMTRTWALELGADGITCNAVAPGPVVTDMFDELVPDDDAVRHRIASGIPVRRLGHADDIAHAVAFLLDPRSSFITGQTLFVCGGASIGSLSLS